MEIFVLGSNLAQEKLVEGYFSFIWTERYAAPSEFQIEMPNTFTNRNLLKVDAILMISDSDQPQVVETTYVKKSNGTTKWVVKGRDLTTWMELRQSPYDVSYSAVKVSGIAYNMIMRGVINPPDSNDQLPYMDLANTAADGALFDFETGDTNLLDDVQNILNDNNLGIRCSRIGSYGSYGFRYTIYNGQRRSVFFSDRDDTLVNTSRIISKRKFRNRAEIRYKASNKEDAKTLTRVIYGNGGSASQSGLSRRTIRVNATGVNAADYPTAARLNVVLDRMGRAALSKTKMISAVDGEVPGNAPARYVRDYKLGDIVKYKADDGTSTDARVLEYIWTIDETGFRSYPTIDITPDITV